MLAFPASTVTQIVSHNIATQRVTGAQVVIVRNGKIVYQRSFGTRAVGGPPVDAQTRFEIGSATKQFTAAAILQLKERGKLRLDDRLAKYLPSFPHANAVTLRQLLNQTSGLPDFTQTNHFFTRIAWTQAPTLANIERLSAGPLHFTPGTRWEYSNTNYTALGRVIEVVSHHSYHDYVRTNLFAPAGMTESTFIDSEKALPNVATGYWNGVHHGKLRKAPVVPDGWLWSAGDIVSTASDLAKWDIALTHLRIISRSDLRLMSTPPNLPSAKPDDYGFGCWIDLVGGHTDVAADGDTLGISSSNDILPNDGLDIIVLENQAFDDAAKTARALIRDIPQLLDSKAE